MSEDIIMKVALIDPEIAAEENVEEVSTEENVEETVNEEAAE